MLLNLVNQLLDITKVRDEYENNGWQTGDAVALMRMVIESLRINAAEKLITTEFEPKQPHIEMDFIPGFMQKIIANLISNSLKFTPRGGRIIVTMKKEGDKVVVNIADTGIGIAQRQQHRSESRNKHLAIADTANGAYHERNHRGKEHRRQRNTLHNHIASTALKPRVTSLDSIGALHRNHSRGTRSEQQTSGIG